MARLNFRLTSIALDEEENVREVTAVVSTLAHETITALLGETPATITRGGDGDMTIGLPIAAARDLFTQAGKTSGTSPTYPVTHDVYDSLSAVFYGLMGED